MKRVLLACFASVGRQSEAVSTVKPKTTAMPLALRFAFALALRSSSSSFLLSVGAPPASSSYIGSSFNNSSGSEHFAPLPAGGGFLIGEQQHVLPASYAAAGVRFMATGEETPQSFGFGSLFNGDLLQEANGSMYHYQQQQRQLGIVPSSQPLSGTRKKAEDLQFLVEDEQSKVTPTTCSMECPNGSSPSTTARSIYDDEGATPTIILELGDGEGKDRMPFIISKDLSELTPIMCLTICSSLDVEPDFTVAAVVTCSNTAMDSKELVATDGATGTTNIDPRVCSKETHTKCLLFGPDVNGVTDRGVIVFQSRMGVFKVVPISSQSMELMVDEKATCTDTTHLPKVFDQMLQGLQEAVDESSQEKPMATSLLR
ncbi:hypothetical protein OsJ_21780 [Oryza sativa Japonica Group]|uniref:Uncharacterized protein n=1 Tax=Oryza sativa subsp. japonica TaxID=39947 RepID=B9FTV9_ORYSJ|nr:hypothetical protein OsJ_21780 [Oryza sativa Japonica Group]